MKDFSEKIYLDFLSELDGLERFRQRFQERHPAAPLDREDPDVRRLIEAMAFFSVQTRHATLHNLRSTWRRLFAGFFDFLLEPVPAAAMAQAVPTEKMVEPVLLTRGTELRLTPAEGVAGSFRLQRDLRVLPIFLKATDVVPQVRSGHRLILRFESRFARKDPIDVLSLHVRHLDDYRSSLAVFHALRKHIQQVSVVYDESADEHSVGSPCEVSFNRDPPAPDDASVYAHPFQRLRAFFQFPEQQLFVHLKVPPPRASSWMKFCLCLDLDKDWTVGKSLHPDFFQLFTVPVLNLKAEPAQVIVADGTRAEHPILSMSAGREFSLHSVTGVFEMTKAGLSPLRPAFLPGKGPSYEVDETFDEKLTSRQSLIVRMPEAFTAPRKIVLEALWHQPQFSSQAAGRVEVSVPGRHIEGLKWQTVGSLQPHRDSVLRDDVEALTQFLAWKAKATLGRDEVVALLGHLGTPAESPFRRVLPWLKELKFSVVPDSALKGSGIRHAYEAVMEPFDVSFEPVVICFLEQLRDLLDAWNNEASVDLRASVAGLGPLQLPT